MTNVLSTAEGLKRLLLDQCAAKISARIFLDGNTLEGQLQSFEGEVLAMTIQFDRFDIRVAYIPMDAIKGVVIASKG